MRLKLSMIMCIAFALSGAGQYTYFDVTHGSENPNGPMTTGNVEVIGDNIVTWSAGSDAEGNLAYYFHKFDNDGAFVESIPYYFGEAFVWMGSTNSFQRIPNSEESLMTHAISDSNGTHGLIMKMDIELDTLWTKNIDLFPPYTYFFAHTWREDTLVIAGEYGVAPGEKGTFLAKLDEFGEVLSEHVIHDPSEGSFRNRYISVVEGGYSLSGSINAGVDTEGNVSFLNESGELIFEQESSGGMRRGTMQHLVNTSGDVIVSQATALEDYPGSSNPSFTLNVLRFFDFDTETGALNFQAEFEADPIWISGGAIKGIESNNGYVYAGPFRKEVGGTIPARSFVMKVDYDFNTLWYTELAYESCSSCSSEVYDLEQTSDGGYVMAGTFKDSENSPSDKTWLVKVDACGDLEWQGCEPVGLGEWETNLTVSISPNPALDHINIDFSGHEEPEYIEILDMSGRMVIDIPFYNTIDISKLRAGFYLLRIMNNEGLIHSEKLIVE